MAAAPTSSSLRGKELKHAISGACFEQRLRPIGTNKKRMKTRKESHRGWGRMKSRTMDRKHRRGNCD
ncbi:hypothetical protein SESBI_32888 [Sesbania bispinosa]|nr:hypothetical protein SESBI_32888 [Sesbania bispinosa]